MVEELEDEREPWRCYGVDDFERGVYVGYTRAIQTVEKHSDWISVNKQLPEEHESFFAKYSGANKQPRVFYKLSDQVNVTVQFKNGSRKVTTSYTKDGKWIIEKELSISKGKVIAWQPLPKEYKGESNAKHKCIFKY